MCQGVIFYTPNLEVLLKVIHCETPRMTLSAVMPLWIFVPSVKKCGTRRDLVSLWALEIHVYGKSAEVFNRASQVAGKGKLGLPSIRPPEPYGFLTHLLTYQQWFSRLALICASISLKSWFISHRMSVQQQGQLYYSSYIIPLLSPPPKLSCHWLQNHFVPPF